MNNKECLLSICIPTYNRASFLERTLGQMTNSPFKNFEIIVSDNNSSDDTETVVKKFPEVIYKKNPINVGFGANILRVAEYAKGKYLWIIGDDDDYDFSNINDILSILDEGKIGLIHVGAHPDGEWKFGGTISTPKELLKKGYHFFRYTSFLGCNIIKRKQFQNFVLNGYNNIINGYPHMPALLSFYINNLPIYISQNRIATSISGNQCYNQAQLINWWIGTSKLLPTKSDQNLFFFDQYGRYGKGYLYYWKVAKKNGIINKETFKNISVFYPWYLKLYAVIKYILYPPYNIFKRLTSKK